MTPHSDRLSRRAFVTATGAAGLGAVTLGGLAAPASGRVARPLAHFRQAAPVSYVDTSQSAYDKLTLMVDGRPFHHSGVQFRYEKHRITYGWSDEQLAPVFPMIREDGFGVVNMSIWWAQVEPEKDVFNRTEIDRYLDLCREHGLKLELPWFGSDSGGSSVGQAIAAKRDEAEFALVSTQDGTFTLPGTLGRLGRGRFLGRGQRLGERGTEVL